MSNWTEEYLWDRQLLDKKITDSMKTSNSVTEDKIADFINSEIQENSVSAKKSIEHF